MKGFAYTCTTAGYDSVVTPKGIPWIPAEFNRRGDECVRTEVRRPKVNPQELTGFDWSLYVDGNITPREGTAERVEKWLDCADMALCRHPHRSCAYVEIEACIGRKKITEQQADIAVKELKRLGHPKDFGLWECGVIARRTGVEWLRTMGAEWWRLVQLVPRDQVWLPTALRMHGQLHRVKDLDFEIRKTRFFNFRLHCKPKR